MNRMKLFALTGVFSLGLAVCVDLAAVEIPIEVLEPTQRNQVLKEVPVDVGVVLQRGKVNQWPDGQLPPMRLVDDLGHEIPFTVRATGWWGPSLEAAPREVKWLLLHFKATTDRSYTLITDPPAFLNPRLPGLAKEEGGRIIVDTGALRVVLKNGTGRLFERVRLPRQRRPMLQRDATPSFTLVANEGGTPVSTILSGWELVLEESTPLKATVKATGVFRDAGGRDIARLAVRYQFFQGESFVRLYHTLTWLIKDTDIGAQGISLRLKPNIGPSSTLRVGLSDYDSTAIEATASGDQDIYALQTTASSFDYQVDNVTKQSGDRLGGWVELEDARGLGIGVSVKNVWQEYPKAFALDKGELAIDLWPARHGTMSFKEHEIMPREYFCDKAIWQIHSRFAGTGEACAVCGHEGPCHGHEEGKKEAYGERPFLHTGEGAAKTHEMMLLFFDKDSVRTTHELNSINQHPVVLRQDPASAMRVPFMGFQIAPRDESRFPELERAIEDVAGMALARWEQDHAYGFWRYGGFRWGFHGLNNTIYRWFDGLQYDNQLIPWLMFMRGGDRDYYDDAIDTARHAMDVSTNHFNTRPLRIKGQTASINGEAVEFWPPGYMNEASTMPFPGWPEALRKQAKIHYLGLYYHLTGYERAREVMEMIIDGAKQQKAIDGPEPLIIYANRDLYNMNMFWAQAYAETWDEEVLDLSREWLWYIGGDCHPYFGRLVCNWDEQLKFWAKDDVYLYNALAMLQHLYGDLNLDPVAAEALAQQMVDNLAVTGFPDLPDGGVYKKEFAIAGGWAQRHTGDLRYSRISWDIARSLADTVTTFDFDPSVIPNQNLMVKGNLIWRGWLLPMLVGLSQGATHGFDSRLPPAFDDLYVSLEVDAAGAGHSTAYVRPRESGDLDVEILVANYFGPDKAVPPVTVAAFDAEGQPVLDQNGKPVAVTITRLGTLLPIPDPTAKGVLTIPAAVAGETYVLDIHLAPDPNAGASPVRNQRVRVLTRANNAQLVRQVTPECQRSAPNDCLNFFHNAGQTLVGTRVFAYSTTDQVTITNVQSKPYTIRDASTWEVLFRTGTQEPVSRTRTHDIGANRLFAVIVNGHNMPMGFEGILPYLSATREAWFNPDGPGQNTE